MNAELAAFCCPPAERPDPFTGEEIFDPEVADFIALRRKFSHPPRILARGVERTAPVPEPRMELARELQHHLRIRQSLVPPSWVMSSLLRIQFAEMREVPAETVLSGRCWLDTFAGLDGDLAREHGASEIQIGVSGFWPLAQSTLTSTAAPVEGGLEVASAGDEDWLTVAVRAGEHTIVFSVDAATRERLGR